MAFYIPQEAAKYGYVVDGFGAHSGRTIMLADVTQLFSTCPQTTTNEEYREAILGANVLLKKSGASRKEAFLRLQRLYALDRSILLFQIIRQVWDQEPDAQPMLLLLYAIARDPILRVSADLVINTSVGGILSAIDFESVVSDHFMDQLKPKTLASIGRNVASSWAQSGHFEGRSHKVRIAARSFPTSVAIALLLGYLCNVRGENLFHTDWARVLDTPVHELHTKAQVASQQGWLEYRQTGNITDITFDHFLKGVEI